jgi:hypothetical protein
MPDISNQTSELIMATATVSSTIVTSTRATRSTWLARVLAALDRACASSAEGARGF